MRLRSHLVRRPSKNFLAIHQLDIHLCTEFPYTFYRQDYHAHMVYRKRADTVGEPITTRQSYGCYFGFSVFLGLQ